MHLLQSGVDITVIALWLGHESLETTHGYVQADLRMKEQALEKLAPVGGNLSGSNPTMHFWLSCQLSKLCRVSASPNPRLAVVRPELPEDERPAAEATYALPTAPVTF